MAALEQWPESGVPDNPGAWLMATAKHRGIDLLRRRAAARAQARRSSAAICEQGEEPDLEAALDDGVDDDLLRLIFMTCHPVLSREARVALTLRLLGGLTTAEIARAFLATEATVAQRIVRAKRTLAEARVPFEAPSGRERAARLGSVLEVVYLVFNEGYSATAGDDWIQPVAVRGGAAARPHPRRRLRSAEPEVHGLVALMELQASRLRARVGATGVPVLLLDQDRARWDRVLIGRGLAALERAQALGGALGPYGLQAAIAACHARALTARGNRLGPYRGALRRALPAHALARGRAQPRGRRLDGVRPGRRAGARRRAGRRARAASPTTCCPACAASCCCGSVAMARPAANSSARLRSRATSASASCCAAGSLRPPRSDSEARPPGGTPLLRPPVAPTHL